MTARADMDRASIDQYFEDSPLDDVLDDTRTSESGDDPAARSGAGGPPGLTSAIPGGGTLLEEPDARKVFKVVEKTIKGQERLAKNRLERAKFCKGLANGAQFLYLDKTEDRSVYKCNPAPFTSVDDRQPVPNKVADLKRKIISQLLADDYLPNPKAGGDADKDRGAADLAKRFLRENGSVMGTNDKLMLREVLGINIAQQSAFVLAWVDPTGGGWRPKEVLAHPRATDPKTPLMGPKLDQAGQPVVDPATGPVLERSTSPVLRYVAEVDGPPNPVTGEPSVVVEQFTNDPAAAARQWLPKIKRTLLYPHQVRTVPMSATTFEAHQIILIMAEPLGVARLRFPILGEVSTERLQTLCSWRPPDRWKDYIPEAIRPKQSDSGGDSRPTDDTFLFWFHVFCRVGPDYVDGGEVAVNGAGGGFLLKRDTLREDVKQEDGTTVPVLLNPPVAQFTCLQDTDGGDPFGYGLIEDFAGGNDAYARIWMGLLEAVDRNLHLNTYLPSTSPITRAEYNRRDGTPLEILTADDIPQSEPPVQVPSLVTDMLDRIELVMNSEAGINETSSGLDSRYSVSGVAKQVSIRQARLALAPYWQNTVAGLTYFWTCVVQLAQAKLTVPQQVKLSGIESAYKQPWWMGSDLLGITLVVLEPGSGTMMTPAEKVPHLQMMQSNEWIDKEQAGELARSSMTDDLGFPPNIHEERINRALADWAKGPPVDWLDAHTRNEQVQAKRQEDVQRAAAMLAQEQSMDQASASAHAEQMIPASAPAPLFTPFDPRPNDDDPGVALIHYRRLSHMASAVEFGKHEPPWQALLAERLTAARQAAGLSTIAEQQQAQAAQAAAQQQADAARQKSVTEERQFQAEQAAKDRDTKLETEARRMQVQEANAARREASPAQTGQFANPIEA